MDSYSDEHEYGPEPIPMFVLQEVMDMFEGKPDFQRIVQLGILANMGYGVEEDAAEDYEDFDRWVRSPNRFDVHGYGFSGTRVSSSSPQARSHYHGATAANVGHLGASKDEEKAERKRLKRQKRKERKRNEKQKEKEEQSKEENDEKKAENEKPKADVKEQAAAKESDGSGESEDDVNDEDSSACEELDMTSTFVSKARSKLEQKPKPEKEKKIPAKEPKSNPEKPKRDAEAEKKPACPSRRSRSLEENIRISTQLANLGNTYAEAGNFKAAVQCYTDAIKHNLINYKLFGNRSFCFERMRLYMKALDDAEVSLSMHPGWIKGLFRKGKALAGLKRYEEAERAFRQVVEADGSCADAAHELMRVQIAQVMGYGYTAEQSARALSAHKSVKKALHSLGSLNHQAASASSLKPRDMAESAVQNRRSPPESQNGQQKELYPIWVGNLFCSVTESSLEKLFSKVGPVDSVRLLTYKRCAFVNYTKRQDCDEAIRVLNGFEFHGIKIVVRYPDRIPAGMGISRAAQTS